MRLTEHEQRAIQEAVRTEDPKAELYLFGSRTDDTRKGGDIDLLLISRSIDIFAKLRLLARMHQDMGDRKIDLVVERDLSKPFTRLAAQSGTRL